jgi:hypothetical protein|tara:strand:- start:36 stop:239 length:204 start_codon:yes stop_codon:yes gene_type:complete
LLAVVEEEFNQEVLQQLVELAVVEQEALEMLLEQQEQLTLAVAEEEVVFLVEVQFLKEQVELVAQES